ncbi:GNAT family N-acetyltransferase [Rubrivirga marina]|uniref:GNAT family N-acetyltransferase n=1 Tax=Rubrivirga marina TaxID=1196024 RepID=UPI000BA95CAA|nr:GNAT family N-acetyltransferase [Rubrivirga marina]
MRQRTPLRMRAVRLELLSARLDHMAGELDAPERLSSLLDAEVPKSCLPGSTIATPWRISMSGGSRTDRPPWGGTGGMPSLVRRPRNRDASSARGGYPGPPEPNGAVEIGSSTAPERQGNGFATELAQAPVERALTAPEVARVVAHTTVENVASVRVLERCGFAPMGPGADVGTVRCEGARC